MRNLLKSQKVINIFNIVTLKNIENILEYIPIKYSLIDYKEEEDPVQQYESEMLNEKLFLKGDYYNKELNFVDKQENRKQLKVKQNKQLEEFLELRRVCKEWDQYFTSNKVWKKLIEQKWQT